MGKYKQTMHDFWGRVAQGYDPGGLRASFYLIFPNVGPCYNNNFKLLLLFFSNQFQD